MAKKAVAKKAVAKKAPAKKAAVKKVKVDKAEVDAQKAARSAARKTRAPKMTSSPVVLPDAPKATPKGRCTECSRPLDDSNVPHTDGVCGICKPPKREQRSVVPRP